MLICYRPEQQLLSCYLDGATPRRPLWTEATARPTDKQSALSSCRDLVLICVFCRGSILLSRVILLGNAHYDQKIPTRARGSFQLWTGRGVTTVRGVLLSSLWEASPAAFFRSTSVFNITFPIVVTVSAAIVSPANMAAISKSLYYSPLQQYVDIAAQHHPPERIARTLPIDQPMRVESGTCVRSCGSPVLRV